VTAMKLRLLDLFSGIGGFSLGLERSGGFETVAFCEIDPFCRKVLSKHWPTVRQYEDVRDLTTARLSADGICVDAVCGGFPCQPFSTASRGRRVAADLWPEMLRVIAETKPKLVFAENVQKAAIADAARDLTGFGYATHYCRIGADEAGADHQRNRWWAIAYTDAESELYRAVHAEVAKLPALCRGLWGPANYARAIRVSVGVPDRVERIEALGNAVLPHIPELLGRAWLVSQEAA